MQENIKLVGLYMEFGVMTPRMYYKLLHINAWDKHKDTHSEGQNRQHVFLK